MYLKKIRGIVQVLGYLFSRVDRKLKSAHAYEMAYAYIIVVI